MNNRLKDSKLSLLLLLTASTSFTGKVVKITDGDTIVNLTHDVTTALNQNRILVIKQNRQFQTFVSGKKLK